MYEWLKGIILPLLRVEGSEPHPPAGHRPDEVRRVERAHPGFLRLKMLGWGLYAVAWGFVVIIASTLLLIADVRLLLLVIPLIVVAIAKAATLYVTMRLDYEMRWYVITDRSLMIREGVWNTKEVTLTFANAQNVRVTQGPLERYFGFSTVEIETAGGGAVEGGGSRHVARLRGLANPHEVRELILDGLRRLGTAGLGDPDDHGAHASAQHRLSAAPLEHSETGITTVIGVKALAEDAWCEAKALRIAFERKARSVPG
ncbi:MAG: PH domain-containing protein [Gemmatimonadaceae bacterium]|nr:PH domain-containing protein [Gemmatimonadaceae bacterium]